MVSLSVILLLVGLVAGLARGGRLANLSSISLKYPGLVFAGLGLQIASEFGGGVVPSLRSRGAGLVVLLASYLLLIAFVLLNRSLPGMYLVAGGLALNLLVIGINAGMPVSLGAAEAAGLPERDYLAGSVKHRPMGPETLLGFLGDVMPVPFLRTVVSAGDVVLGIGIFLLVERRVRYSPRRGQKSPRDKTR